MPFVEPQTWSLPTLESASGCFETMRAYRGEIFRLAAHLDRLYASAQYLGVRVALDRAALRRRLMQALAASGIQEAIVRVALIPPPVLSAEFGQKGRKTGGGMIPGPARVASTSIVVQPVQRPLRRFYARGIRVGIVPTRKFSVSQIDPQAKYSARLSSVMATVEAQLRHVDEAIFLDATGVVTESTASNLGIVKQSVVIASPCWLGLLAGITWQAVLEAARALKIPVREIPLTRHDLYNANEAFLSSTTKEILPVTVIDGRTIGTGRPGPITRRLHRAFRELVNRELRAT